MKTKLLVASLVCALLPAITPAQADPTPAPTPTPTQTPAAVPAKALTPAAADLQTLVAKIRVKIKEGKRTEADLADELKSFDDLLAKYSGDKSDTVAQILYMKAMLYVSVFENTDKAKELITQLKTEFPDSKVGQRADKILASIDAGKAAKAIQASLKEGALFPDFQEQDLQGQPLSVGNYKGKVVMVDFWATWCGPCRGELPNVIATYKKFHAKGFEIIGVSLDSERAKLDDFLKQQDGMTWAQYFDGKGWENKLAGKYGVRSIPFTLLIGPDGHIIGKDLRGEKLGAAVEKAIIANSK